MNELASPTAGRRWHRSPWLLAFGAFFVLVVVITLWTTTAGVRVGPDSAPLLGTASNFADGKGITTPVSPENTRLTPIQQASFGTRIPISEWPPLYPALIGTGQRLGFSQADATRLVNLAALLATLGLTIALCARLGVRSRAVWLGVAALVLLGPSLNPIFGGPGHSVVDGLSENLFIPLVLAALLSYGIAAVRPSRTTDVLAVGLTVLVVMTRWAGMGIGLVGAITILVGTATPSRNRLVRGGIVLVSAPIATVSWSALSGWLYGAGAARALAWHPKGDQVMQISRVVSGWFFLPPTLPAPLAIAVAALALLGPLVLVLVRRNLVPADSWPLALALALFPPVYLANTIAAQTLFDAAIPLDQRILIVIQPVTYIVLASLGYHLVRRVTAAPSGKRPAGARRWVPVSVALLGVLCLAVLAVAFVDLSRRTRSVIGRQIDARQSSVLNQLPEDYVVFSNSPSTVWIFGSHGAYTLPNRVIFTTDQVNEDYAGQLGSVGDLLRDRDGLVVLTPSFLPGFAPLAEDYQRYAGLEVVGACDDEELQLMAVPLSAAAALGRTLCPAPPE